MKRTYFCLKCRATLNPDVKLILTMAKGRRRSLSAPAGRERNALIRLLAPGCTVSPTVRRVILFT